MKQALVFFIGSILYSFFYLPQAHGYSQNYHKESYVNLPTACAGVRFWVTDYFTTNTVDLNIWNVRVYSRNWGNRTTRELTLLATFPGPYYGHQFRFEDLRNGGGGCLLDANNIYIRADIQATSGNYQDFSFDAPLVQPPGQAGNATLNVDVLMFTNNNGYGVGNVGLLGPNDSTNGGAFTTNYFPDRYGWLIGPRDPADPGVIPSIGSYFDYGLRLITTGGPDGFQWASPETFYPGFHSGGPATGCVRHISDNAPGLAPPPNIAFDPCTWPDGNSHGTQMYKPGTNFTDPYPYDGLYTYNWTYGIGPWNATFDPSNPIVMSPQQSYWSGHAISQADQSAQSFHLATDIRPTSIVVNGAQTAGLFNPSQNMSFTANIHNYSTGVAANVGTPVTYSLVNTATGVTVWTSSATLGTYINPGGDLGAVSGAWFSSVGTYRVDVCANNPVTRYTVQNAPVCTSQFFTVGSPPQYTLQGYVYVDTNSNGVRDVGEPPLPSAVTIYYNYQDVNGNWQSSSISGVTGSFTIPNLYSGVQLWNYAPAGYVFTYPNNAWPNALAQGYNGAVGAGCTMSPSGPLGSPVACSAGNISNVSLGMQPTYTVSGYVYRDLNNNGRKDGVDDASLGGSVVLNYEYLNAAGTSWITGTPFNPDAAGNFTISGIFSQVHVWMSNPDPTTYQLTYPNNPALLGKGANTQGFDGKVGPGCTINPAGPVPGTPAACLGGSLTNLSFGITPIYSIAGYVFDDKDNSGTYNAAIDTLFTAPVTINVANNVGTIVGTTTTSTGNFTVGGLTYYGGNYTVTTTLPAGTVQTFPTGGALTPYTVTLGPGCSILPAGGTGVCSVNGVTGLNFGVTSLIPWEQFIGFDARFEDGFDTNVPTTPAFGPPVALRSLDESSAAQRLITGGVFYTGAAPGTFEYGMSGSPVRSDENHRVVGGSGSSAEEYSTSKTRLHTSYDNILALAQASGQTPIDITTRCTITAAQPCDLQNLNQSNVYQSAGDIHIGASNYTRNTKNIIILAGQDVYIDGDITLANNIGSTIFIVANRDIIVKSSVGLASPVDALTSGSYNLAGEYIAGHNFTVQGNDRNCAITDKQLVIQGSVVVNANLKKITDPPPGRGIFDNHRDLCANDSSPTVAIKKRLDFLINAPEFIKVPSYSFKEDAP